jgi:hypothetical protein
MIGQHISYGDTEMCYIANYTDCNGQLLFSKENFSVQEK